MVEIARPSKFIIFSVALLLLPTVVRAGLDPTPVNFGWALVGLPIVVRMSLLTVAVNKDWVVVRNFFSTSHVPLWEAEVEFGEVEGGGFVSDSGGKLDEGGRTLYVRRSWHENQRIVVTIAPRYGQESQRVHDELNRQIALHRAL